jgi:hypothetical protein
MNIEHRTLNTERPIWMALRFIYFKNTNRSLQGAAPKRISPGRFHRTDQAFAPRVVQDCL